MSRSKSQYVSRSVNGSVKESVSRFVSRCVNLQVSRPVCDMSMPGVIVSGLWVHL